MRTGEPGGDLVTAGIYVVPERVRRLAAGAVAERLRDFLAWLVATGEPVYGVVLPSVVDVDRPEDVRLAEALLHGRPGVPGHAPRGAR